MKKYIYATVTALLVSSVFSCKKIINQVPVSQLSPTNFYKNAADAEAGILGCYDSMQGDDVRRLAWGDAQGDGLVKYFPDPDLMDFLQDNINSLSTYASWQVYYAGLNRINNVIYQVPTITDPSITAVKTRIMGEAYFLRGFEYFFLTRLWGDVPLILTPTLSLNGDFKPHRAPAASVLDQVIADLKLAAAMLPISYANNIETRGRATRGAALALLSKVYLWRSSLNNSNEWKKVSDYADSVRAISIYQLVSTANYGTIFTAKNTTESIFELEYDYKNNEVNSLSSYLIARSSINSATQGNQTLIPSNTLVNSFEPGDVRKNATIFYDPQSSFPTVPAVYKYQGTISGSRFGDSDYIFMRLSDVILEKAEALAQLGDYPGAITLINIIRNRAGLANTTATTKDNILLAIEKERFVELAFEGHRWYDLLRTGRVKAVLGVDRKPYLPVPGLEIQLNSNLLPQNPGY